MDEQETIRFNDERFWCENCCNFDKEHVGMDGTATCKLTDNITYCESSGKNCVGFNVSPRLMQAFPVLPGDVVVLHDEPGREYCVSSIRFYRDRIPMIIMTNACGGQHKVSTSQFREIVRYINGERVGECCEDCIHVNVCEAHADACHLALDYNGGGPNCRFFKNKKRASE